MKNPPEEGYNLDPICIFHGLRQSEHYCLVCCLCFNDMTIQEGMETGEDVCITCKKLEGLAPNEPYLRDVPQ